jgi:hypothetical protein
VYHAHTKSGLWEAHVGTTLKLTSASNTVTWATAGAKLGGWYSGGFYAYVFRGYIGEFKVWKGAMSSGTVTSEITDLGAKWGLAV